MDLLKTMVANRQSAHVVDPKPTSRSRGKKTTKAERAKEQEPGTRGMRAFIIAEKPSKKVVKEHLEAIIANACESSSDGD